MYNKYILIMKKNNFNSHSKFHYDFKKLTDQGFKIKNQRKLDSFCNNYGFSRVINGYAASLLDSHQNFVGKIDTNQLIKLAKFDRSLGVLLLSHILDFETRFNSILISLLLKFYKLDQNYVLTLKNSDWLQIDNYEIKKKLITNLYQPTDSNLSKSYSKFDINRTMNTQNNSEEPPLNTLSLSWTFGTIINLFEYLHPKLQQEIIYECLKTKLSVESFLWLCNIIRKLRNKITHNDFILVSRFKVNDEIKKYLQMNLNLKYIQLKNIADFLDKVDWFNNGKIFNKNLDKKIRKLIKKCHFQFIVKRKVLMYLGYPY